MGEHYAVIPAAIYKAQMIVRFIHTKCIQKRSRDSTNMKLCVVLLGIRPNLPNKSHKHKDVNPPSI